MCYRMLRAAAFVDESDHHALALMYVREGQVMREEGALFYKYRSRWCTGYRSPNETHGEYFREYFISEYSIFAGPVPDRSQVNCNTVSTK